MPIFGGKDIASLNETVEREKTERTGKDDRALIPKGIPVRLVLTNVSYEIMASRKVPGAKLHKISLEMNMEGKQEDYKPLKEDFFVESTPNDKGEHGTSTDAIEVGQKMLVGFFQSAFNFKTPTNIADYHGLVNVYQQWMRKPFLAAVRHQKRFWIKDEDGGKRKLFEFEEAKFWYAGSIANSGDFSIKPGTHIIDYDAKAKAALDAFKREQGIQGAEEAAGLVREADPDGLSDLPFE